jgi:hypothetical protein
MTANIIHSNASANATVNTYWCVVDVFKDQVFLQGVLEESKSV